MEIDVDQRRVVSVERYLENRIAIVTGGFSGIGKAIAIALAERGATIAVGGRRVPNAVVDELSAVTDKLFYERLDVADSASVAAFVNALEFDHGPADILVNSAGVTAHELVCGSTNAAGSKSSTSIYPARFA